ncbi:MAG TPA: DUF1761 domain-containing protein [Candidatus Binatia bacterium]|nr:DUF1761 domain-containing protein [Candidatus Binatia bacterium]
MDINYWAVLVCGVAAMITGFLWYGPLFSKAWAKEMGWGELTPEQTAKMQAAAKTAYPQQFVGALLMAYVFAHVVFAFNAAIDGPESLGMNLQGALWSWLGFIAPVLWSQRLWGGKSIKLFWIDSLYYLLNLGVFAVIFSLWK